MSKHSKLSPSGSSRWLNCPGSINLIDSLPEDTKKDKPSFYSLEGTAAHALGEKCLENGLDAKDYLLKQVCGVTVSQDMVDAVQIYLDYIRSRRDKPIGAKLAVEQYCSLEFLDVPGMEGGTSDAVLVDAITNTLEIVDYKHGKGVAVEVEENTQLMMYAVGAVDRHYTETSVKLKTIYLTIVQPRAPHQDGPIRTYTLTTKELLRWAAKELVPIAESTQYSDAPLSPGEKQCRFCAAAKVCRALHNKTEEVAQIEFANIETKDQLPSPDVLTPEQIGNVLTHANTIRNFLKEVESYARALVDTGTPIEGFKLVEKMTRRKFRPNAGEELMYWIGEEDIYDMKMRPLGEIEKCLKLYEPENYKEIMGEVTDKPTGETVLAKSTDKRKEVQPSVTGDFNGL